MLIKGVVTQEITQRTDDWRDIPKCVSEMLGVFNDDVHQKTLSISFKVTKGKDVPYSELDSNLTPDYKKHPRFKRK
tara:strand:+ start:444 stop:671 length:228 start_codon:yes stop_codon:yes gene_type:complete